MVMFGLRSAALLFAVVALASPQLSARAEEKLDPAQVEFFENKIRPVLAESCYNCHSQKSEKVKGGLFLDTKDGLLKGGDNGPAIVPGDPDKSLLIKAVRYSDPNLQMPPKDKKLSSEQIADLEAWVKMGAPDPRTAVNQTLAVREGQKKNHWAFQPIKRPAVPEVSKPNWTRNPIDNFVFAKLDENGMKPSARADKRTLIRRATFDLIGLPPTHEEVEAFLADDSERALEVVVDRLLASPQYGERWARHWLDVARYADTKGYVFEEERRYPYSYTYRDYVIRAFNEDLPYNRFIIEQLAADLLPLGEDKRPLAAMGFLTLGRRFLNNQPDIIDDRIDVVTRGFMGLTVQCARCHDHKYDPIPTKDYYSLYGVFASSSEPSEKPLLGAKSLPQQYPAYQEERKKRVDEMDTFRAEKFAEVLADVRSKTGDYLLAALDAEKLDDKGKLDTFARERKLHPIGVRRWMNHFEAQRKKEHDPVFAPLFAFAALTNFTGEAKAVAEHYATNDAANPVNPIVAKAFEGAPDKELKDVTAKYKMIFEQVEKSWTEAQKDKKGKLENADEEALRQVLYAESSPARIPDGEIPRLFDVPAAQKSRALQRKVEELDAVHPGSPPRGMTLQENSTPHKPRIFVRGSQFNLGDEVPRQFLAIASGPDRKPFEKGGGRLELAESIASKDNPFTSRVLVNRVWINHFGAGLVTTPSDFGVRSDAPSHPELLDYLAAWFMENGWSLKKLHKLILLSNTYQQASNENAAYAEKDPTNRLLSRMNRRRLEFEPFRDSVLQVTGRLDLKQGGQPVEITTRPFTHRRTVYSFIERQNLPGIFRTFDFASPDATSPQRFNTTVPQQALFMINSPFLAEQTRSLAKASEAAGSTPAQKIERLYEAALQRSPLPEEVTLAQQFVEEQAKIPPPEPPVEVWKYGYGELDASFILISFKPLPHFNGKAWQGGDKLPDDKLGWLMLNNSGGHPGEGLKNSIIRRWTAPQDCTVTISGTLEHNTEAGDGVRGLILSSRTGLLQLTPVYNSKREMSVPRVEVKKGETIDFIVDSNVTLDSDSFNWSPNVKTTGGSGKALAWNAKQDFAGPAEPFVPFNAWEKYAQVLLMSNEFAFVD